MQAETPSLSPDGLNCPHTCPPARMFLPVPVPLSGESDDKPQVKAVSAEDPGGAMRLQDRTRMSLLVGFSSLVVGVAADGRKAGPGTARADRDSGRKGKGSRRLL